MNWRRRCASSARIWCSENCCLTPSMQNSPVALVLVDANDRVAYANIASRHLLNGGRSLQGLRFHDALAQAPAALQAAAAEQGDNLFSTEIDGVEETFHLSQRAFILQGRTFRLYLLKRLTRELSRQEVSTWKKLIRVLSATSSTIPWAHLPRSRTPAREFARRGRSRGAADRLRGHLRTRRAPAPVRQRLCRVCQIARAAARIGRHGQQFIEDLRRAAALYRARTAARAPGWFDRVQAGTGADQYAEERARGRAAPAGAGGTQPLSCGADQRIEVRDRGPE